MIDHQHEQLLADLASGEEAVVLKALHAACPCSGSDAFFAQNNAAIRALEKDARPHVRAVAKHVQVDALDQLRQEDERAGGFRRNRPGGSGRRGETRRAAIRQGWQ